MEAMLLSGILVETSGSEWTPQPMPLIKADKEALAYLRVSPPVTCCPTT
jgi:hypothetical protein